MFSESGLAAKRNGGGKKLKVRAPKWAFDDLSPGQDVSVFARTLFHALSLVFPDGERFFIRSVKAFQDKITDPTLLADIKAFIGQEVQHGRVHEFYNEKIVGSRFEIENYLKLHRWVNYTLIEPVTNWLFSPKFSLSVTAAAEHYTATWAHNALTDSRVKDIKSESLRNLIYWHAIEEIEHKHVAFDVLREVDDNYFLRISGILFLAVTMPAWVGLGFVYLLAQEKDFKIADVIGDMAKDASSGSGLTRQFVNAFFSYFRPGFHPDDIDDAALVAEIAAEVERSIKASAA